MENSIETTIQFKLYFEDDTTANLSIGGLDYTKINSSINTIKSTVRAFNANPSEYSNLMVSKAGAPWIGIKGVTISTVSRHYIF